MGARYAQLETAEVFTMEESGYKSEDQGHYVWMNRDWAAGDAATRMADGSDVTNRPPDLTAHTSVRSEKAVITTTTDCAAYVRLVPRLCCA